MNNASPRHVGRARSTLRKCLATLGHPVDICWIGAVIPDQRHFTINLPRNMFMPHAN